MIDGDVLIAALERRRNGWTEHALDVMLGDGSVRDRERWAVCATGRYELALLIRYVRMLQYRAGRRDCSACNGLGEVVVEYIDEWPRSDTCDRCGGTGHVMLPEEVPVVGSRRGDGLWVMYRQLKQAALPWDQRPRQYGCMTRQPGDIDRRVVVGVQRKAADHTTEQGLRFPIGRCTVPAGATGPAGIPRVHRDQWNTRQPGFVGEEGTQLKEGPGMHRGSLRPPNRHPRPNPTEVFDADPALRVFRRRHDAFTHTVVDMCLEAMLPASPDAGLGTVRCVGGRGSTHGV